jgi:ATP-dependent Clp protease ATP-binding subunit ClpB
VEEREGKTQDLRRRLDEALRETFKPEFLNRIDDIVYFNPLGEEEISKIIELQIEQLRKMLAEKKVQIELLPAAKQLLFQRGYDPNFGARPLRRAIQTLVQDPLALKMLQGEIQPGDSLVVDADADKGVMKFQKAALATAAV